MNQLDALMAALGAAPALPGARCRGRSHLFDGGPPGEDDEIRAARIGQALALCHRCPALAHCRRWHDSLPVSRRPVGVVAGRVNTTTDRGQPPHRVAAS
ncbi:hypothetical protein [Mycolicibacterium setense]|uniref:hypothetical protein n=1 Tax=Mycolicibacterium setense TaxID=431269 RepID=UPI000574F0B7|nr:hypothetical protein [Mycolicibacterium setense]KHO18648.1 hypothetical protein QQ25_24740 [Mycolicibacterium setense]MCV7111329.1 hypothetical protein [Mycolicibacterium setense]